MKTFHIDMDDIKSRGGDPLRTATRSPAAFELALDRPRRLSRGKGRATIGPRPRPYPAIHDAEFFAVHDESSFAPWLDYLNHGDEDAARRLWERYFPRLFALARSKLGGLPRRAAADEEGVALSVFDSVLQRARRVEFPDLHDKDGLWRLLMTVTFRKAARLIRDQPRQKRGGGLIVGESALPEGLGMERVAGLSLSPATEAELSDAFLRLLDVLADEDLRRIALWKMDEYMNKYIFEKLSCAPATVEWRLALIREIWERERLAFD